MSRIRTVKPEFFRHEVLQALGPYHMLVFEGLWTQCDAQGVFEDRPRFLKLDILPFMDFDMDAVIADLAEAGMVVRYESGGKRYGFVPTFSEHQRISGKEAGDAGKKHPLPECFPSQVQTEPEKQRGSTGEATGKHPGAQEKEREKERINRNREREGECEGKPAAVPAEVFDDDGSPPDIGAPPSSPLVVPDWWEIEETTAASVARCVASCRLSGGKPAFPSGALPEHLARKLGDRLDRLDPGEGAVEEFLGAFVEFHAGKAKPPYTDPSRALGKWLDIREPDWVKLKKSRHGNYSHTGPGPQGKGSPLAARQRLAERYAAEEAQPC